jgi:hypothetical protein
MEANDGFGCWESAGFADQEHETTEDPFGTNEQPSTWPFLDLKGGGSGISVQNGAGQPRLNHRHAPLLNPGAKTKKGWGPESRAKAPDPHDFYDFQSRSSAYILLRVMGYKFFTLGDVVRIGSHVEDLLLAKDTPMTERNRAARRRKPNAFHWLDENWANITPEMFKTAVVAVLGDPSSLRIRRRHGVKV